MSASDVSTTRSSQIGSMGDDNTSISTRGQSWGQAEGCERTLIRSDTHMACTEAALGPVGIPRYCEERTNAI